MESTVIFLGIFFGLFLLSIPVDMTHRSYQRQQVCIKEMTKKPVKVRQLEYKKCMSYWHDSRWKFNLDDPSKILRMSTKRRGKL
jgi:hypothetical protein